jgi:hypothetical protein
MRGKLKTKKIQVTLLTIICFALLLVSCAKPTPKPKVIEQKVNERLAAVTSSTPYPSYTPQPTYTPYPTFTEFPTQTPWIKLVTPTASSTPLFTPTDTSTPTITFTPTRTPTITPTPNATKTELAIANATKGAHATATKQAQSARATELAHYKDVPTKDFVTYPDKYIGQKVKIRGRVFNINSDTEFQMWAGWSYDAVYIVMLRSYDDIYEDNWITVYGEVEGEHCGTNAYGGEVCQPLITGYFYEKK